MGKLTQSVDAIRQLYLERSDSLDASSYEVLDLCDAVDAARAEAAMLLARAEQAEQERAAYKSANSLLNNECSHWARQTESIRQEHNGLLKRLHDGVVFSRAALADRDARIAAEARRKALADLLEEFRKSQNWKGDSAIERWMEGMMAEEAPHAK